MTRLDYQDGKARSRWESAAGFIGGLGAVPILSNEPAPRFSLVVSVRIKYMW